jgi:acyl transferase domain-containing protein
MSLDQMSFEPIAIIGRGCVLPGAPNPDALWNMVRERRIVIGSAPRGRWGADPQTLMQAQNAARANIVSDKGGFVDYSISGDGADAGLDQLTHWLIACGQAARATAGKLPDKRRTGLITGNLSYPSQGHAAFVERFWTGTGSADPRNRFSSGAPVHYAARALDIEGPAFALDAACASSLYALKLACDRLHDGELDLVYAGGANRADSLFLHLGFTALQALSPSGQSRPFHRDADGLLPAEGAGLVALKRLSDAIRDGNRIFGVIRGIGLSNDGRQNGFLAPALEGQVAAMRAAFEQSGLEPRDIGYLECHATGTARGDAIELESIAKAYGAARPVIGSLKANLGHSITASGIASALKMLSAFEAGELPPSPPVDAPLSAIAEHGFKLLNAPQPWTGEKRAAISNFGFGGNNAHLLLEAYEPNRKWPSQPASARTKASIALVGAGILTGETRGLSAFAQRLFGPRDGAPTRMKNIALDLEGLGFPPNELMAALPQQTALLAAASDALDGVSPLPKASTGVFIGMGCDTFAARHGLRLRVPVAQREPFIAANGQSAPALTAAGVLGTMPNLPANRLNAQRDFRGQSFTIANEENSGVTALNLAIRALANGELDAAIAGASDFSCEPAHEAAARAVGALDGQSSDTAIILVLKRLGDARAAGDTVLAVFEEDSDRAAAPIDAGLSKEVAARFGKAHAAQGLLEVLSAALAASHGARIDKAGAWPTTVSGPVAIEVRSFTGQMDRVAVRRGDPASIAPAMAIPVIVTYAAASRDALIAAMESGAQAQHGALRLGIAAESQDRAAAMRARAISDLRAGGIPVMPGLSFGEGGPMGEVAFTFTAAAAAYSGAGREMLLAFPEIASALVAQFGDRPEIADALYGADTAAFNPFTQLTSCAFICQAHAAFARDILKLKPQAAIGLSSGETNALLAFGVWRDLGPMLDEIRESGLYGHALTGECRAAAMAWGMPPGTPVAWRNFHVSAPIAQVEAAMAGESRVYITIRQTPEDCVIGGDAESCARVLAKIGKNRALPLGLDMVVHAAPFAPFANEWRRIHRRQVHPAPSVRFYSNGVDGSYTPSSDACADAITKQAAQSVDFARTIERAYADGVRIFVENGPRAILTSAVARILRGRPHAAMALDRGERGGLLSLSASVLQLWASGVQLDIGPYLTRLTALRRAKSQPALSHSRRLTLPAHAPDVVWPKPVPKAHEPANFPGLVLPLAPKVRPSFSIAGLLGGKAAAQPPVPLPRASLANTAAIEAIAGFAGGHRDYLDLQVQAHMQFLKLRGAVGAGKAATARAPKFAPVVVPTVTPISVVSPKPERQPAAALAKALWTRAQLEALASGKVSEVFGPLFARQDGYRRQVRMPQPPLLLADRVMVIEGEPGGMGKGRIVTETDVTADAWYMHAGRMSPGPVIEAGQADLLLSSWLGADFHNKSERVYRLLGCELTFHGPPPKAGDTLRFDIHIDGWAKSGDVRLFFFHYDASVNGEPRLSVRNGQAGFFTDEELAGSGGVLWDAEDDAPAPGARCDTMPNPCARRSFDRTQVTAFADGDAAACFGAGFEMAAAHRRTPTIPNGPMQLIDEVLEWNPSGGPWGRGYLRAQYKAGTDAWFYKGHFKNDPCMPGTLMADAAVQALSFAMAAMGFTLDRDGWRFEPAQDETAKFVCRGQVTPDSDHVLDYEIFIEEIIGGAEPMVFAALLCRSDGFKVFQCRRFGVKLTPDWPLATRPEALKAGEAAHVVGGADVRGDHNALMACAWGRPSDAFGALYTCFDGARRAPRLPGPPYHFVSRIERVEGEPGIIAAGRSVVASYDVPTDAWYFGENAGANMPFAALSEILLQPCGWLASYQGFAANRPDDVVFRNLDGMEALIHRPVSRNTGRLRIAATLDRFAQAAGTTVVFFNVACSDAQGPVMTLKTSFGFFSPQALQNQIGLAVGADAIARLRQVWDRAPIAFAGPQFALALPAAASMRMIDEVTGYWPQGGEAGLGLIRGRQIVDPHAWYFKAHFFQDPVQPGSLGLEALFQLFGAIAAQEGHSLIERPATGAPFSWKFRGQVLPTAAEVITEVEIVDMIDEEKSRLLVADGSLWTGGKCIYQARRLPLRIAK